MTSSKARALSLSISLAIVGCTADAETSNEQEARQPTQAPVSLEQVTPQADSESLGGLVTGAAAGGVAGAAGGTVRTRDPGDPTCPAYGCGANHNRRLVRV